MVRPGLYALVGALAPGRVQHLLHGVTGRVVDRGRAQLLGQPQPVGLPVDHEHLVGPAQLRRQRGHQPDRPGAPDDHGIAGADLGQLGAVVAGGQDVRQHHVVGFLLPGVVRQHQGVPVGPGHPQQLGLPAVVRAHVGVAVSRAGTARVGGQAEAGQAGLTVLAEPAANVERQAHHVADLDPVDAAADLDHLAQVLVPEDLSFFHIGTALVHMQVTAADVGGRDPDQRVGRPLDPGVRYLIDRDLPGSVVDQRSHAVPFVGGSVQLPWSPGNLLADPTRLVPFPTCE
jgi:hypothetical protein